jgi:hypothetical protein
MITQIEIYKYGLTIENIVIDYLESIEYEIITKYNNDNSHDIIVKNILTNNQFNIEIKGDRQAYKTNNFISNIRHMMCLLVLILQNQTY